MQLLFARFSGQMNKKLKFVTKKLKTQKAQKQKNTEKVTNDSFSM